MTVSLTVTVPPSSLVWVSVEVPNRTSAEFLIEPFLQAYPERPTVSPRCLLVTRTGHIKIMDPDYGS